MTITREQVADLQVGDVVEVADPVWLGSAVRGPLVASMPSGLGLALHLFSRRTGDDFQILVRDRYGDPGLNGKHRTLTVISRAPRPLYVNHPRTEPVAGDVVRDADSSDPLALFVYAADPGEASADPWPWLCTDADWQARRGLPARLRLLVDGETGQVVR